MYSLELSNVFLSILSALPFLIGQESAALAFAKIFRMSPRSIRLCNKVAGADISHIVRHSVFQLKTELSFLYL